MSDSFKRYSLRKAREEAEDCLIVLTLNFETVYSRISSGLRKIRLIEFHLKHGGSKSSFNERGAFDGIDLDNFTQTDFWHSKDRDKIIKASANKKHLMLKEIVEFCSDVIAISAREQLS